MYLASVSDGLKIYDCASWKKTFTYGDTASVVEHINWSDDGKYLLQVCPNGRVEILSTTEDGVRCLQCLPEERTSTATFHRGGHRQVAVAGRGGKLFIWDTKFKSVIKSFSGAPAEIKMLDFNSKNKYLAAGLESGDTLIYNVMTNSQIGVIKVPFSKKVSSLRFHSDLRSVLGLASDEGCVVLRDIDNGKNRMLLRDAHKSVVSGIQFSNVNKDVMVSCGYDKMLHVYDTRMQIIVSSIQTESPLNCVDISCDSLVALGNKKGEILIYDLREFSKPANVLSERVRSAGINRVAFQPEVAKRKRLLALDASLKEPFTTKTPQQLICKTPDSVRSYDFMAECNTSSVEAPSQRERTDINASKDSFLVNIVGGVNDSDVKKNSNLFKDSTDFAPTRSKDFSAKKSQSLADKISGKSESTPIIGKNISPKDASPSPILKAMNLIHEFEAENESNNPKYVTNSPIKKLDSVDSVSIVETVKCTANNMAELGNDLKDFITFSIYDVLEQSRNNFMQMTIQQTKNRLFLEDQISNLSQRVQDLQQTQNILIEENKRLSIEVEMLRSARC